MNGYQSLNYFFVNFAKPSFWKRFCNAKGFGNSSFRYATFRNDSLTCLLRKLTFAKHTLDDWKMWSALYEYYLEHFSAVSEHVTAAESILTHYLSHFQDRIHFLEGPFIISGRFRCPRLLDGSIGRPRFEIPERTLWANRSRIGFKWVSIAKMLMVFERTLDFVEEGLN